MSEQVTTLSFFRFRGIARLWAFVQMAFAPMRLRRVSELSFFKLMGSGGGDGFSLRPDFSVYVLLAVWPNEERARAFLHDPIFLRYDAKSRESWTLFLHTQRSRGQWSGVQPFAVAGKEEERKPVVVLTRASIRPRLAFRFWRRVPSVGRSMLGLKGLYYAKGVGERPLLEQATITLWRDREAMLQSYQDPAHRRAIEATRTFEWFSEELFARFLPFDGSGTWEGKKWEEWTHCGADAQDLAHSARALGGRDSKEHRDQAVDDLNLGD